MAGAFLTSATVISTTSAGANESAAFDSGATGSDRLLAVEINAEDFANLNLTAISYDGQALTDTGLQAQAVGTEFRETIRKWYLVNPPTGVNTLQLTNSGHAHDLVVTAKVYTGVDQSSPIGNNAKLEVVGGGVNSTTINKQAADNIISWSWVQNRADATLPGTLTNNNHREVGTIGSGSAGFGFISGDRADGSGSVSVGPDDTSNQDMELLAVELVASSGGITGSGTPQAQDATVSGTAEREVTGSGTPSAQAASVSGTATREITSNGDALSLSASVSGSGSVDGGDITGSGTPSAQDATVSGTAEREITGSGTPAAQAASVSGTAAREITGAGSLSTQAAIVAGLGERSITGSGSLSAQAAQVAGAGGIGVFGSGDLFAQSASVSGAGPVLTLITQDFPEAPVNWRSDVEHRRKLANVINTTQQGKLRNTGTVMLDINSTTTTVEDSRLGPSTVITFMPLTANASAELYGGSMYVGETDIDANNGQFTINHSSNAQVDRFFRYMLIG